MAAGWYAAYALPVAVGHKAKTLCSGVFVSHLAPAAILADLESGDLTALKHVHARIDDAAKSVTADFLGVRREAVHREGLGCTLVLDGLTPPVLPAGAPPSQPAAPLPSSDSPHPLVDAAVARAFAEPDPLHPRRTLAVVVMRGGRTAAERYASGISRDTPLPGWSMTKSATNALVGILVRDGRLALNARVSAPEWRSHDDPRAAITLDHLLRMESGLAVDEGIASVDSDVMRMLFGSPDAAAFAAGRKLEAPPGTRYRYSNGTTNIIARKIRSTMRDEAEYLSFPRRALFDPLGMTSAVMETDAAGNFVGSSYMLATARDWARFGQLYLQDGVWNGQRILPEGWVAYTTTPAPADPNRSYGAHFALEVPRQYAGANAALPAQTFHAVGHEGQFVTIVPARDTVIVRLGRTRYASTWDHAAFVRDVLAALGSQNGFPITSR